MSKTKQTEFIFKLDREIDFNFSHLNEFKAYVGYTNDIKKCDLYYNKNKYIPKISLIARPSIVCPYSRKIIRLLKKEVIETLSETYQDDERGELIRNVYYLGNFKEPLILNDVCNTCKVTIIHEYEETDWGEYKNIFRYLDIVLYKEEETVDDN